MNWFEKLLLPGLTNQLQIAKLRVELSSIEGRIEALESRQGDLADRFTRFQNREGMRSARAQLEDNTTLAAEAASILADSEASRVVPGEVMSKADLWRRRKPS